MNTFEFDHADYKASFIRAMMQRIAELETQKAYACQDWAEEHSDIEKLCAERGIDTTDPHDNFVTGPELAERLAVALDEARADAKLLADEVRRLRRSAREYAVGPIIDGALERYK